MPRRDPDAGHRRTGLAGGGRCDRQSAVLGRQAPDHPPRRGLRLADVRGLLWPRSSRSRSRLLLVREGRSADRFGQGAMRGACCDQLHPGWSEPSRAASCDCGAADPSRRGATSRGSSTAQPSECRWSASRGTNPSTAIASMASRRRDLRGSDGAPRRRGRRSHGGPASSAERRRGVHGGHEEWTLRHRGRSGTCVASSAGESERPDQRRRAEAVGSTGWTWYDGRLESGSSTSDG